MSKTLLKPRSPKGWVAIFRALPQSAGYMLIAISMLASMVVYAQVNTDLIDGLLKNQGYRDTRLTVENGTLWLSLPGHYLTGSGENLGRVVRIVHESAPPEIREIRVQLRATGKPDCLVFSRALLARYYQRMLPRRQLIQAASTFPDACDTYPQTHSAELSLPWSATMDLASGLLTGWRLSPEPNIALVLQPIGIDSRIQQNDGDFYADWKSYLHAGWQPGDHWQLGVSGYLRWQLADNEQTTADAAGVSDLPRIFDLDARRHDKRAGLERAFFGWRHGNHAGGLAFSAGLLDEYLAGAGVQAIIPSGLDWLNLEFRLDRINARESAAFSLGEHYATSALGGVNLQAGRAYARLLAGRFVAGDEGVWLGAGYRFSNGTAVQLWSSLSEIDDPLDDRETPTSVDGDEREHRFGLTLVLPFGESAGQRFTMDARNDIDDVAQLVNRPLDLHGGESRLRPAHYFDRFGQ
ncbi:YjbH domain-containing protein [Teredinibacter turnerae]|uniref:YjbH domain-containing protein n=1 Tax=Teredinibacter turnerae TaxID=2426 RepID=UPI00037935A4|nr:YjbH domain-containing protein [Teredinibacter turnerae]